MSCTNICTSKTSLLRDNVQSKRKADDSIPFTLVENNHILKKMRLHHTNPDGTLTLQSANHSDVKLLPLPTPHVGSHDSSIG